jgi:hypothetical protein
LNTDDSISLSATAYDIDGNSWDVRDTVATTWVGPGSRDAIINGIYRADTMGTHRIVATYDGQRDTCIAVVRHGATVRVEVLPATDTLNTDDSISLSATAYDIDGNSWNVRDTVATTWVGPGSRDSIVNGIYQADTVGTHRIIAIYDGQRDTCIAEVQHGATVRVDVLPATYTLNTDDSISLSATAYDIDGNSWDVRDTVATTWVGPGSRDAIINGIYRADTAGVHRIIALYDTYQDTCIAVVNHGVAVRLEVTPAFDTMTTDSTRQFTATAFDTDSNNWQVTNDAVWVSQIGVTIANFDSGLFVPTQTGSYRITAAYGGQTDSGWVLVRHGATSRLVLSPDTRTLSTDDTLLLAATAYDAKNNGWDVTDTAATTWRWAGSRDSIVGGIYRADTAGVHLVMAVYDGYQDTSTITVNHGAMTRLEATPDYDTLTTDDSLALAATAYDADNNPWDVTALATWTGRSGVTVVNFSNGLFSPVTAGAYTVTATYGGFGDSSAVQVNHGATVRVLVSPDAWTMTTDDSLALSATAYDAENNSWNVRDTAATTWQWTGSRDSIINGIYRADSAGTHRIIAIYDTCRDTCMVTVDHGAPAWLVLTPDSSAITADSVLQFTAMAHDADNNTWDVTGTAVWTSNEAGITVDSGRYDPLHTGTWQVQAATGSAADTSVVVVRHGLIDSISVTPAAAGITADDTLYLTATAFDQDKNSWVVTDSATTIWTRPGSRTSMTGGRYLADTAGTWDVTATNTGHRDTCAVMVRHGAVDSLVVTPATANVTADDTVHLVATAFDRDKNSWAVTDSALTAWAAPGSRDSVTNGNYLADTAGVWRVIAANNGQLDTCMVTVRHGFIDSLAVTPATATVTGDDTVHLTATAFDQDRNSWVITDSSATTWTYPGSRTSITGGRYLADTAGIWQVTAANSGQLDTCVITVGHGALESLAVTPETLYLTADQTGLFTATAYDADQNPWDVTFTAAWNSNDAGAGVDSGRYTPVAAGPHRIWAVAGALADTVVTIVSHGLTDSIGIQPDSATITADSTLACTLWAFDADRNRWNATDDGVWSTTEPTGLVDSGRYAPVAAGTHWVRVFSAGYQDSARVMVLHGRPDSLRVAPVFDTITTDSNLQLTATAYDADRNSWEVTFNAAWSTDDVSVLPLDSGRYNPDSTGSYRVWAVLGSYADTAYVEVGHGAPVNLIIRPAADTIIAGQTDTFMITAYDADSMAWDVSGLAVLTVAPDSGITVTGNQVRGIYRRDNYQVVAAYTALFDTAQLTVRPDEPAGIRVEVPTVDGNWDSVGAGDSLVIGVAVFDQYGNPVLDTAQVAFSWYDEGGGNVGGGEHFTPAMVRTAGGQAQTWFKPSVNIWDNYRVAAAVLRRTDVADTSDVIVVIPKDLTYIKIVYGRTQTEVLDTTITTDQDSLTFQAAGYDVLDNFLAYFPAQWRLLGDSIGYLTPLPDSAARLTAIRPDTAQLEAVVFDSVRGMTFTTASGDIRVLPGRLWQLVLAPRETSVTADDTLRFTARGFDRDLNPTTALGTLTWRGGESIGRLDSVSGRFEATTVGADTVRVTSSLGAADTSGRITVTRGVLDSVALAPAETTLTPDLTLQISATAFDRDKNAWDITDTAVWFDDDPASVTDSGRFHEVRVGTYHAWIGLGGLTDTTTIHVMAGPVETLWVTPRDTALTADDTLQLAATAADAFGNYWSVTGPGQWSIDNTGGGTFAAGRFDPKRPGSYRIWCTYNGATDTAAVLVRHGRLVRLTVAPADTFMTADDTLAFMAAGYDADSNSWNVTDSAATRWNSDDASVNVTGGHYNPDSTGTYRIWAASGSYQDTGVVTVYHGRIVRLVVLPDTARITTDSTLRLTATAFDADHNGWNVTDSGSTVWTDSDPRVAVVNGVYNPDRVGTCSVTAAYSGYRDTSRVFVTVGAIFDVRIQTDSAGAGTELGDSTVEAGWNLRLAANAYDRDSNFISLAPVTWSFIAVNKTNNIDSLVPASGAITQYRARRVGTCRVRALHQSSPAADTTGILTVRPSSILHHFLVPTDRRELDINAQVTCSLKVYDRYNNLMTNYGRSRGVIQIGVVLGPNHDQGLTDIMGDKVVDRGDNSGYIDSGAVFTNGVKLVYVTYNVTEETLHFAFTDSLTGVSAVTRGVIWKDPSILSHVEVYPNPYTIGTPGIPGMIFQYVLRDNSTVWIRVFSLEGSFVWEKVFSAGDNPGGRAGLNKVVWDGTNGRGRYVGTGGYIMKMWVESPRGPAEASKKIGIVGKKK